MIHPHTQTDFDSERLRIRCLGMFWIPFRVVDSDGLSGRGSKSRYSEEAMSGVLGVTVTRGLLKLKATVERVEPEGGRISDNGS